MIETLKKTLMEEALSKHKNIKPCFDNKLKIRTTWDNCYSIIPEMNLIILYFNFDKEDCTETTSCVKMNLNINSLQTRYN